MLDKHLLEQGSGAVLMFVFVVVGSELITLKDSDRAREFVCTCVSSGCGMAANGYAYCLYDVILCRRAV
jgi:hypothetical protein